MMYLPKHSVQEVVDLYQERMQKLKDENEKLDVKLEALKENKERWDINYKTFEILLKEFDPFIFYNGLLTLVQHQLARKENESADLLIMEQSIKEILILGEGIHLGEVSLQLGQYHIQCNLVKVIERLHLLGDLNTEDF